MDKKIEINKLFIAPGIGTLILLLIPFSAMMFFSAVNWSLFDFLIAGFLFFITGFAYKLFTYKFDNIYYKIAAIVALFFGLLLVWINLAVGIIGDFTGDLTINLVYFFVIAIGIFGALISRFSPDGMSLTLFYMSGSLVLIAILILIFADFNINELPGNSYWGFLGFHSFFGIMFVMSGLLFHKSKTFHSENK